MIAKLKADLDKAGAFFTAAELRNEMDRLIVQARDELATELAE